MKQIASSIAQIKQPPQGTTTFQTINTNKLSAKQLAFFVKQQKQIPLVFPDTIQIDPIVAEQLNLYSRIEGVESNTERARVTSRTRRVLSSSASFTRSTKY
jgi:ABC-type ATPase involved in cell division